MKTRPIGEVFMIAKVKHVVVKDNPIIEMHCLICSLLNICGRSNAMRIHRGECRLTTRTDHIGVHFELLKLNIL